jgi:acetyl esterase/lipase
VAHFADRLRAGSGNPVVFAALPGGQHSFDRFNSPRFNAVVDGVREFASRVRAPRVP